MIENVSTQLTMFHCFAHCLLPGRAFASLYVLLFLEKEAEIGGREIESCHLLLKSATAMQKQLQSVSDKGTNFGRAREVEQM